VDSSGALSTFSTIGQDLDILAPGRAVLTTALEGSYSRVSGTSFSAPLVAGAAALVWSRFPEWSADEVAWSVQMAAQGAGSGWTLSSGWGLLDAAAAVASSTPPPVLELRDLVRAEEGWTVSGTVADAGLVRWSLSALTLPHGLVRVVVAEALYRAWSLRRGHPYHRA